MDAVQSDEDEIDDDMDFGGAPTKNEDDMLQ